MYYSRGHFLESWILSITIEAVLWHFVDLALPSPSICLLYDRGDRVMGIRGQVPATSSQRWERIQILTSCGLSSVATPPPQSRVEGLTWRSQSLYTHH